MTDNPDSSQNAIPCMTFPLICAVLHHSSLIDLANDISTIHRTFYIKMRRYERTYIPVFFSVPLATHPSILKVFLIRSGQVWGHTPGQLVAASTLRRYYFILGLAIAQAYARPVMRIFLRQNSTSRNHEACGRPLGMVLLLGSQFIIHYDKNSDYLRLYTRVCNRIRVAHPLHKLSELEWL